MNTFKYPILRRLHLWLAIPLALFLVALGLTGTLITWMHELDVFLNPQLLTVAAEEPPAPQSPSALLARLNGTPEYASPYRLELPENKNDVLIAWYKTSKAAPRQVMVNPYTGAIIGERNWGEAGLSRPLLMPALFHLHRQLLAGETGKIVVSINAILLAVMVASGIYLGWPSWRLKAWRNAITVSLAGSWKRFNFSLHRAAGFYCAPVFLMLALTGIYFNKPQWIRPIAGVNVSVPSSLEKPAQKNRPQANPLPLQDILRIAQNQFPSARISRINLPTTPDVIYEIRLLQPGELRQHTGATRVRINGADGTVIKIQDPLKARRWGWDWISSYFFPLHSGEIFGFAGKLFISLFGLMPLVFAVSGALIWVRRKRR